MLKWEVLQKFGKNEEKEPITFYEDLAVKGFESHLMSVNHRLTKHSPIL